MLEGRLICLCRKPVAPVERTNRSALDKISDVVAIVCMMVIRRVEFYPLKGAGDFLKYARKREGVMDGLSM